MKKFQIFFLSVAPLLFLQLSCNTQQKEDNSSHSTNSKTINANNKSTSEELYERLMYSFSDDWIERESDPNLYPIYYGGSFVNTDGTFVVAVTGDEEENRARLIKILRTEDFQIETVKYSFQQMMLVMDKIDAFLMNSNIPEDHPLLSCFAGAYPAVLENRIKVTLTKTDEATLRLFRKEVSDSPLIIFEKGKQPVFN